MVSVSWQATVNVMAISDEAWKKVAASELRYILKYQWRDSWKTLYRNHLRNLFNIGCQFPGKIVVDVGCGPVGVISVVEAQKKVGVDPLIDEFRRIFKDLEPDVEYINAKAEDLPLPDDYVDVVFCVNTLNHVQDPERALRQIARILKPEGPFYFDVHDNPRSPEHPHVFTRDSLFYMLKKHFHVLKMSEWPRIPSISYDVYCAWCSRKLKLRQRLCPKCGSTKQLIKGPRTYLSKTRMWGALCTSLKSSN